MDYEKKLAELENLVKQLEEGGLTLEESISVFEKGVSLTKECLGALNDTKAKFLPFRKKWTSFFLRKRRLM